MYFIPWSIKGCIRFWGISIQFTRSVVGNYVWRCINNWCDMVRPWPYWKLLLICPLMMHLKSLNVKFITFVVWNTLVSLRCKLPVVPGLGLGASPLRSVDVRRGHFVTVSLGFLSSGPACALTVLPIELTRVLPMVFHSLEILSRPLPCLYL